MCVHVSKCVPVYDCVYASVYIHVCVCVCACEYVCVSADFNKSIDVDIVRTICPDFHKDL